MSKSHKYDPSNPNGSYDRKVRDNYRRRNRQGLNRQREFTVSAQKAQNNEQNDDFLDPYGDYDYSRDPRFQSDQTLAV